MGVISCYFFWKVHFKYLEAKYKTAFMEDLSNESSFKLVLIFLKLIECFHKRLWFSPKIFSTNFKQKGAF